MRIAALIPAYNEERNIAAVVQGVRPFVSATVVIDDGSADNTTGAAEAAGAIVLRHKMNAGKGAALKTGFRYLADSGYDGAVTIDADGQHDSAEIPLFIAAAGQGYDMVIGNRMSNVSTMPFIRRFANHASSYLVSLFLGQNVRDSQNGFRYYKLSSVLCLPLKANKYDLETEVIFKLGRAGYRIGWVPTRTIYRREAKSKVNSLTDTLRFFGVLVRYGLLRK
ncbi:MAG: glycosyltransferase family 2 protein [Caldiserica bacterium]|nr:glycosyltransferase family 2 protein [Caldisericota bacterium]